jgi:epoxyqueuosine reductase
VTPDQRALVVKNHARALGFDSVGVTTLDPTPHQDVFAAWLDAGMAGTMTYLHRQAAKRWEPGKILPGASHVIMLTANYHRPDPIPRIGYGLVAKYARGRDYHVVLRAPLEELTRRILDLGPDGTIAKPYVDAGPVPERELAQRAGLGWIGKNTMLIDPRRGSFHFLASILTNLDLAIDPPFDSDHCGTCRRCLDACPTDAFPEERVLDSRRCISYLTIEHRGGIAPELQEGLDGRIFGCDACQDVCPWNRKFARAADNTLLDPDDELALLSLDLLSSLSDEAFEERFGWTALERPGPEGMRRNVRAVQEGGWRIGVRANRE